MNDKNQTRIKLSAVTSFKPFLIHNHVRENVVSHGIELTIGSQKIILDYDTMSLRDQDILILDNNISL